MGAGINLRPFYSAQGRLPREDFERVFNGGVGAAGIVHSQPAVLSSTTDSLDNIVRHRIRQQDNGPNFSRDGCREMTGLASVPGNGPGIAPFPQLTRQSVQRITSHNEYDHGGINPLS
jgi:hypothetical protein